ncbi:MAG TPA: hypothetical protein VFF39_18045 [Verrucomicrobiae bacterium]|nr:hypothetical protein [Verrucomicrobiae bacterium]
MRKSLCIAVIAAFVLGLTAQPQQNIVPSNYRILVANTPPANKADLLARGILTVQDEAIAAQRDVVALRTQAGQTFDTHEQQVQTLQQSGTNHEQRIKTLEQDAGTRRDANRPAYSGYRGTKSKDAARCNSETTGRISRCYLPLA